MHTSTVSHVLDGSATAKGNLQRATLANIGSLQVGLEERAHLSITGSSLGQDGEVDGETEHVDEERENDEANNPSNDVGTELDLLLVST